MHICVPDSILRVDAKLIRQLVIRDHVRSTLLLKVTPAVRLGVEVQILAFNHRFI